MSALLLALVGIAAGFVATRLMKVELTLLETVAVGVIGALAGGFALRLLVAASGFLLAVAGAVIGACAMIWLLQRWRARR